MKVLLAADGSTYTKKALAWLLTNENLPGVIDELVVLTVQPKLPARVITVMGRDDVSAYQQDEARKVLAPIEKFLARHDVRWRTLTTIGPAAEEIVRVATREKSALIVMGTHGRGALGRAVMGSVAQRVVAHSPVPVLLVR